MPLLSLLLLPPADPSPRVRSTLEALLLRQLAGRRLLPGNLLALPLYGQQAVFVVERVVLQEASGSGSSSAAAAGPGAVPRVTGRTAVRLLVAQESPDGLPSQQGQQDWAALAAAAAAESLGCSPDDAGPQAARRAAAAGLGSRGITFAQLGGAAKQVGSRMLLCCCAH